MAVYRFEDLRVWQAAKAQCDRIGDLRKRSEFRDDVELSNQMNKAGLSVANNISEGFLRHRDREFMQFLRIAAGSNGEVRTCLMVAHGRNYIADDEAEALIEHSNVIGRMIRRLQSTLSPGDQRVGRKAKG
jgi:four helix bundle protein